MAVWTKKVQLTQAVGFVDMVIMPDDAGAIRVPEAWWLQVEACLTSNAALPVPPLVNPSAGSLAISVRTPGSVGFSPAQIDGAPTIVSLTSLPLARMAFLVPAAIRFTATGLDADKTLLLITLNGVV